jgi:hypothetical protein
MSEATLIAEPAPSAEPVVAGETSTEATLIGGEKTAETPAAEGEATPKEGDAKTEDKPAGEGDKPAGETEEAAPGAPEAYTDFTVPEGVELDTEVTGDLKTLAKELNLPQETAQKIADLGVKLASKHVEAQAAMMTKARTEWAEQSRADAEIGGANLDASVASARKALDFVGSKALTELLEDSGLGNHPEFIRAFAKFGKAISEDKIVTGNGNPNAGPKTLADRLYPSS